MFSNKIIRIVIFCLLCLGLIFTLIASADDLNNNVTIAGRKYIKIYDKWYLEENGKMIDVLDKYFVVKLKENINEEELQKFSNSLNVNIHRRLYPGLYILRLPENNNPIEMLKRYYESGLVEYAEVDIAVELCSEPEDTYFDYCTNLHDPTNDYDIDALEGWEIETGDSTIVIAIIDTGFKIDHPDLQDRMNAGYNFYSDSADSIGAAPVHGTKVAGIAAAEMNNSTGVSSVAGGWNDSGGVRIMPLACAYTSDDSVEVMSITAVYDAIRFANQNGADVINMSFTAGDYPTLASLLDSAYTYHDIVLVAAVGDNSSSTLPYPAKYPNVIAVGASTNNYKTPYTNYGDSLDVVAPSGSSLANSPVYSTASDGGYGRGCATSCAAPQVSGLAGLLLSYNPSLTAHEVTEIICKSADKVGDSTYNLNKTYGAWDDSLGYGRINVFKSLFRAKGYGTITTNVTWHNDIEITGDVVVPSGITLTIDDGVEVSFANSKKLDVYGTLILNSGVTLTRVPNGNHWGKLDINSGATLSVTGPVNISYSDGVDIYGSASFPESTSTISNNYSYGLQVFSGSPTIDYIEFIDNGEMGIGSSGSGAAPTVSDVTVIGYYYGAEVLNCSNMTIEYSVFEVGYDCIYIGDNDCGLDLDWLENDFSFGGSNFFAIRNQSSPDQIGARSNYWGSEDPYEEDLFYNPYNVIWYYWDNEPHGYGAPKIAPNQIGINPLKEARELEDYGNWNGALEKYYDIIINDDNLIYKRISIINILRLNKEHNLGFSDIRSAIQNELITATSWYKASLDYLMCETYVYEGNIDKAVSSFSENIKKYSGTSMEVEMLCRLATIYADYYYDKAKAKEFADKAALLNPGQDILYSAYTSVDVKYDPSLYTDKFKGITENFDTLQEPEEKPLSSEIEEFLTINPNPFNPIATITYSIKSPSHVTLNVYNITGQKVATLVNDTMSAGVHTVRFDGSNLASGIYFYRFESPGFEKKGKMLLVK